MNRAPTEPVDPFRAREPLPAIPPDPTGATVRATSFTPTPAETFTGAGFILYSMDPILFTLYLGTEIQSAAERDERSLPFPEDYVRHLTPIITRRLEQLGLLNRCAHGYGFVPPTESTVAARVAASLFHVSGGDGFHVVAPEF